MTGAFGIPESLATRDTKMSPKLKSYFFIVASVVYVIHTKVNCTA
jgi:hypothetical protein